MHRVSMFIKLYHQYSAIFTNKSSHAWHTTSLFHSCALWWGSVNSTQVLSDKQATGMCKSKYRNDTNIDHLQKSTQNQNLTFLTWQHDWMAVCSIRKRCRMISLHPLTCYSHNPVAFEGSRLVQLNFFLDPRKALSRWHVPQVRDKEVCRAVLQICSWESQEQVLEATSQDKPVTSAILNGF